MPNNTLPGKDARPDRTIADISKILCSIDLEVTEANWLNPAPGCWSVHLQAGKSSVLCTNGKGTSRDSCLASGLAEFIERLATNFFFADYYLEEIDRRSEFSHYPDELWYHPADPENIFSCDQQTVEVLTEDLQQFYNPENELVYEDLLDNNTDSSEKGICALPFYSIDTNHKVYFPVSLLNNLYVSNGMAAGNSRAEATAQALGEIIERYAKKIIIQRGISLPEIPQSHLNGYPVVCAIQRVLKERGYSIRICDGSLGGQFPVICVLLTDFSSGTVYAAFGASLRFEVAIERTLTELLQGRDLDRLGDFMQPSHLIAAVADNTNLESHFINSEGLLSWRMFRDAPDYAFTPWDFRGSTEDEVKRLLSVISAQGFSVFRSEYMQYSFYSCRIIVPGMSEIYPVDELIFNNRNSGSDLRNILLQLPELSPENLLHLLENIESLGLLDQQLISEIIGVIFSEGSAWQTLRLGELKAMIYLALGKTIDARQWCEWCVLYGFLPEQRCRFYRLLHTLLSLDESAPGYCGYEKNIRLFHSEKELDKARKTLLRQETFPDLEFGRCWQDISSQHKNLLDIYMKQQEFKKYHLK